MSDIVEKLNSPSWTPGRRDFPPLFELLAEQSHEKEVLRALLRAGDAASVALIDAIQRAEPPARGRLAKALQRFAANDAEGARQACVTLLHDADPHTQRMAITAVGQWGETWEADDLEARLLELAQTDDEATQRGVLRALEKFGGERTRDWLASQNAGTATVERRLSRTGDHGLVDGAKLDAPLTIEFACKPGLEGVVQDQLKGQLPTTLKNGRLRAQFRGPLELPLRARAAAGYAFILPPARLKSTDDDKVGASIAEVLASGACEQIFRTFGGDAPRFRLNWRHGKHRAVTRAVADALQANHPWLVNDPVERDFEVHLDLYRDTLRVKIEPRVEDNRFAWRVADVPASSHPTVAAALVWLSRPQASDVVWDPFCGAGLEVVERSLLPAQRIFGSDIDPDALTAARKNAREAGAKIEFLEGDAATLRLPPVDAIISNPPLGWRVHEDEGVKALMEQFVPHAARLLKRGGRMVWTTRFPDHTDALARKHGLEVLRSFRVDLGGMNAQMQVLVKR